MRKLLTLPLLLAALSHAQACDLVLEDGWVGDAPPVATMRAGYGVLHNRGDAVATVDGVRAAGFDRAEIHETVERDGMLRMREVEISVAPGEQVHFQPNGKHFMLIGAQHPLAIGATVELTLEACGRSFVSSLPVRAQLDGQGHDPAHDHHGHHHDH